MNKKILWMGLGLIILLAIGAGGYFYYFKDKAGKESETGKSQSVSTPEEILDNKFGFLIGAPDESKEIKELGAAWARPHPGPFLWDSMQSEENEKISFKNTDKWVEELQENNVGMAPTIWPFADWDQKGRPNAESCKVRDNDEFLPHDNFFKGDLNYISQYRCNPNDWVKYADWIKKVVERYDGDGYNDMQGLEIPIKHWEVLNEPDLISPDDFDDDMNEESSLEFYREDPEDYAELLKKTYKYIKEADENAQVIISGAAGGGDWSLGFYRRVFADEEAINSFDIGNVHCISSDDYTSFNLEPYLKMFAEFGITKTAWVTESEAIMTSDPDINATLTYNATKKVFELGADRVFYTRREFEADKRGKQPKDQDEINIKATVNGDNPEEVFEKIFSELGR